MGKCAYCDINTKTNLTNCLDEGKVCSFCLEEQLEDELDKKEI